MKVGEFVEVKGYEGTKLDGKRFQGQISKIDGRQVWVYCIRSVGIDGFVPLSNNGNFPLMTLDGYWEGTVTPIKSELVPDIESAMAINVVDNLPTQRSDHEVPSTTVAPDR